MPAGTNTIEDSNVFQWAVYEAARDLVVKHSLSSVLDLGCGIGMKLDKLIAPVCKDITGVDTPNTIAQCEKIHSFGNWYSNNLEGSPLDLQRSFEMIIAADVIEHMVDPDKLLTLIKKHSSRRTFVVLSTPERDQARGCQDMGPPPNSEHAREWSFSEFREYISNRGFRIISHFCCPILKTSQENVKTKSVPNISLLVALMKSKTKRLLRILQGNKPSRSGCTQVMILCLKEKV